MINDKTEKIYELDSYKKTYTSKVVSIDKEKNLVVLNATVFFPTGGGQECDLGVLGGVNVLDVYEKDGIVYHEVDDISVFKVGDEVFGEIDFDRRYDFMCQHTGEHILSGIVTKKYGFKSTGFHIGEPYVRVDYSGYLTDDMLKEVMNEVGKAIADDYKVNVICGTKDELKDIPYRSKKEIDGIIRVVDCGVDICACCAPHVGSTIEVGSLICVSNEKYKRGSRLMLLAKERAYKYVNDLTSRDLKLCSLIDSKLDNLYIGVENLTIKNKKLESELIALKKVIADNLYDMYSKVNGNITFYVEGINSKVAMNLLQRLGENRDGYVLMFFGEKDNMSFAIYDNKGDAKSVAEDLLKDCKYRGGGRKNMFQGKVEYDDNVKILLEVK